MSDRLDPSNVDQFTVGEVVQDWRLVPNDNNIGQRNVVTVGPGSQALIKLFEESSFWVGNPHRRTAVMRLGAVLPRWLARARWQLRFATASRFELRPGESREVRFRLRAGERFNPRDVENATERDILVMVDADDLPIGGMTYRLEPRGQDDDEVSAARRVARKKVAKRAKRPAKKTARARSR